MKVIALVRVSTQTQALEGYGLDVQEARIRAWAKKNRHRIVAWIREEGVSGSAKLEQRVGLVDALRRLVEDQAQGIVVSSLDRLSREMVVQEQLLAEIVALGGQLHSTVPTEDANLTDDASDPQRKLIRQIIGSIHEYERALIRLRLRAGYERKAQTPGAYMGGRPPYGWAAIGNMLRPLPHEQKIRRRIKDQAAAGWSMQKIADKLNADGVPTKSGVAKWHPQVVSRVVGDDRRTVESASTQPGPDPADNKTAADRKAG